MSSQIVPESNEMRVVALIGERNALRAENARLTAKLEGLAVTRRVRRKASKKITDKQLKGCTGKPFVVGRAARDLDYQKNLYLAATRKQEVPAHDPAFGRMA